MLESFEEVMDKRWKAYDLSFRDALELNTEIAKSDLNLPKSNSQYLEINAYCTENAPLFATKIVIDGTHFMYDDDHRQYTVIGVAGRYSESLPSYRRLKDNKVYAETIFSALEEKYELSASNGSASVGDFAPFGMILLDQFRNPIAIYKKNEWINDYPARELWPELINTIKSLEDEARFEMLGDNHSSSRRLHEKAADIKTMITVAKNLERCV